MRHTLETHGTLKSLGSILLRSYCLDGLNLRGVGVRDTDLTCAALFLLSRPLCIRRAVLQACKRAAGKALIPCHWQRLRETFLFHLFVCPRLARCVNIYNTPESFPPLCHQSLRKGSAGTKQTVVYPSVWCRIRSSAQCTLDPVENF